MTGWCVLSLRYGSSGVCSTLGSFAGRGDGFCGTAVLKFSTTCFSSAVYFYPGCGVGLYWDGLWRASVSSVTACATASDG